MANHRAAFLEGVESIETARAARSGWGFPEALFRLDPRVAKASLGPHLSNLWVGSWGATRF